MIATSSTSKYGWRISPSACGLVEMLPSTQPGTDSECGWHGGDREPRLRSYVVPRDPTRRACRFPTPDDDEGRQASGVPRPRTARYGQRVKIDAMPEDPCSEAVALWHECGLTRPWNDAQADFVRAVSGSASEVLGARDVEDRLLGTAMVGHDGHRGWVYYLAVAVAVRRQGLGRELMRACEEWVRSRGVPKIQLMVRHGNEDALAFYEGLGYTDGEVVVLGRFRDCDAALPLLGGGPRESAQGSPAGDSGPQRDDRQASGS